jgi:hypothetical protein
MLVNKTLEKGTYQTSWDGSNQPAGIYYIQTFLDGLSTQSQRVIKQ